MMFQNKMSDGRVQCTVCPRYCQLKDGQTGFCSVRQNENGRIISTTYGINTGLAVDPIEKKPLYRFLPNTKTLSFGTLGCNMGCCFCQNWHITKVKNRTRLYKASPKQIAETAIAYECQSVAFTYNDPVIWLEYAIDTAKECHKIGLKTVAVTAGYINSEPRKALFEHIDAVNVDLKAFNAEFYRKFCLAKMQPILDTIKYIHDETDCHMEITTLLIEGENDSNTEIKRECEWILQNLGDSVPLHFSAFFPSWKLQDKPQTSPATIYRACEIAKEVGLRYVYTGNI